ncbi:MAG TPA: hypothetical protein VGC09_11090 [Rhodopila sp.]
MMEAELSTLCLWRFGLTLTSTTAGCFEAPGWNLPPASSLGLFFPHPV